MNKNTFALKGNICFSRDKDNLAVFDQSYVVCENGLCKGVFPALPEQYQGIPCHEYPDQLILPGLVDLHVHAPQYSFRGLGMDMELIDWLNTHTFPEEGKYANLEYAQKAYDIFVSDLARSATTRACIFATAHNPATLLLMELLEQAGLHAYVGKVNMDRNSPDYLWEANPAAATEQWILESEQRFQHVKPILTPRFIPSCSDKLMAELSTLQQNYHLPVQSHLSENLNEIQWVKELAPDTRFYGEAYDKYHLFGGDCPTVMAHCVYSSEEEIQLMKRRNVFVAHCPQSNTNLSSGISPVRKLLDLGVNVGLGSDIAAGASLSIFRAMADAIQCSKLRWRLVDQGLAPLTFEEAFYLGTKGGGAFFGSVGSFEAGYEFDAIVLDDSNLRSPLELTTKERLERLLYLSENCPVTAKYIGGNRIFDLAR